MKLYKGHLPKTAYNGKLSAPEKVFLVACFLWLGWQFLKVL